MANLERQPAQGPGFYRCNVGDLKSASINDGARTRSSRSTSSGVAVPRSFFDELLVDQVDEKPGGFGKQSTTLKMAPALHLLHETGGTSNADRRNDK
jgi:hypothetical protein